MNKKAFTLIELLVVVLIIGILAAIALPQYNKAVLKSRLTQGIIYARFLHDAQKMYYLANGEYAAGAEDLGIDLENDCPDKWTCKVDVDQAIMVYDNRPLSITYNHYAGGGDIFYCYAATSDAEAVAACKTMGTDWDSDEEAVRYRLN